MCSNCGQSDVQCTCPSNTCVPCSQEKMCPIKLDASCVIYHILGDDDEATKLTCLGLPNYTTVEEILEKIDDLICGNLNIPITTEETFTTIITASGAANHHLKTDVKVSADDDNIVEIRPDGLYVPTPAIPEIPDSPTLVATDSATIDFTTSGTLGHNLTGNVKVSPDAGNNVSAHGNGIYAPKITVSDTATIDLTLASSNITAAVKISPDEENIIVAHGNGIYATAASSSVTGAQNGTNITVDPGKVELGGELLHDTTISSTHVSGMTNALNFNVRKAFEDIQPTGINAFLIREGTGGTLTGSQGAEFGLGGQIWINNSSSLSLRPGDIATSSGLYAAAIKGGNGNLTGNILSGAYFCVAVADDGDIDALASLRIGRVIDPPGTFGGDFTGTITNFYGIYVENPVFSYGSITNTYGAYINGSGAGFANVVQQDWTVVSDERIKENIKDIEYGLPAIEQLRAVEFNYIADDSKHKQIGFIAQEVETIIPEAVDKRNIEGLEDFRLLDKNVIFTALVKAVQELSNKVKDLESKLKTVE